MSAKNTQLVEVRRVAKEEKLPSTIVSPKSVLGLALVMPVIKIDLSGPSPLAKRQATGITEMCDRKIPQIKVSLFEGSIKVNGKDLSLPIGTSGRMTGAEFKKFAGIYQGDALFVRDGNSMQRVRDSQAVEITADSVFTHEREKREFTTVTRYRGD